MGSSIAHRSRERLALLHHRARLVGRRDEAPACVQQLRTSGEAKRGHFAVARQRAQERTNPPPVVRRRGIVGDARPLRRTAMPARAGERFTGLLAVMRQERGALVEMLGVLLLDGARHRGMHLAAALLELAAERDLLRQRMLERILGDRIDRLLVDELGAVQRRQ